MNLDHLQDRPGVIAGLRELADYLEANPGVPVPWRPELTTTLWFAGPDADKLGGAAIDEIADHLGVESQSDSHSDYATREFSGVEYRVSYVTRDAMRDYNDRYSYTSNVQTEAGSRS